jgi:Protein of unknown function (DUF3105)
MRSRIVVCWVALAAAVLLAGCGSSSGPAGSDVVSPDSTTASVAASSSVATPTANVPGYTNPEVAAKAIDGLIYKPEPDHNHVEGAITYDTTPPIGGNHSQYWADCSGTVYPNAIANENAVHALEHGLCGSPTGPGWPPIRSGHRASWSAASTG